MDADDAFVCIVPRWRAPQMAGLGFDISEFAETGETFQRAARSIVMDGRTLKGVVYFARAVRGDEWPAIDEMIIAFMGKR